MEMWMKALVFRVICNLKSTKRTFEALPDSSLCEEFAARLVHLLDGSRKLSAFAILHSEYKVKEDIPLAYNISKCLAVCELPQSFTALTHRAKPFPAEICREYITVIFIKPEMCSAIPQCVGFVAQRFRQAHSL
jgi:hypothetical protein